MKLPQTFIVLVLGILCFFSCKKDIRKGLPQKQEQDNITDSLKTAPKKQQPVPYFPKTPPIKKKETTKSDTLKPRFATP
ncbi:hypothetical protein [uncultured Maribacter sp.]|uniref:hypothetical protein n=1 Tax=uncultured Maribacter sp. TaxID=431308 RepID=UPI0026170CCB|nr:hypothetical protein [uncultured Maribacter sp.]